MFVPLPNLDDRRWAELVNEGLALIPVYSSTWTNENYANPGITLAELLAWATEGNLYRINRVSDADRLLMLALTGIAPQPPQPASAVFNFALRGSNTRIHLPQTTQFSAEIGALEPVLFESAQDLWVQPVTLAALLTYDGVSFTDATLDLRNGKFISLFGNPPGVEAALYLGFEGTVDTSNPLSLTFEFSGGKSGIGERDRLLRWAKDKVQACQNPLSSACSSQPTGNAIPELAPHHSARTVWEAQTAPGVWTAITAEDDTRSMTLDGSVRLHIESALPLTRVGRYPKPLAFIRCRLQGGEWDAPPVCMAVNCNALQAWQRVPLVDRWVLAPGVAASGPVPPRASDTPVTLKFNAAGEIVSLDFSSSPASASFRFLQLDTPAAPARSSLALEALRIGIGDSSPNQWFRIAVPELTSGLRVLTSEDGAWKEWKLVANFQNSGPADLHCNLQPNGDFLIFGDGQSGRVAPAGCFVVVAGSQTLGLAGNIAARAETSLDAGIHNIALLGDPLAIASKLAIALPRPAQYGADAESLRASEARAAAAYVAVTRAVTTADCEQLALTTPGTQIARAMAASAQHPAFPCFRASGVITVVVVPDMPGAKPAPSTGLLQAVSSWLNSKRLIGTGIEVRSPEFLEVQVIATITSVKGQPKQALQVRIVNALNSFLDALHGGPNGSGWPLGRSIYGAEILDVIASVPGVDHVDAMELNNPGCGPQCGNICLKPFALAAPGRHQIQVN